MMWAIFGLVMTCFSVYVFGQWIFSPAFAPVPLTAADAMAPGGVLKIRILEFISVSLIVVILYAFLIRPWRQTGQVSFVGLTLLGAVLSYVLDVMVDLKAYWMAWNKHSLNMGVWSQFFPFHTGPTQYAEGIVWGVPMYCYFGLLLGSMQLFIIDAVRKNFKASLLLATVNLFSPSSDSATGISRHA
jgi:hypothetical protein